MKFSLRWLREYLDADLTYEEVLDGLMTCGHEVEETTDLGAGHGNIVVGKILEINSHPNADKLHVCKVEEADGQVHSIVCGATNIEVGQHVPFAKTGATLPNGMTLKPTAIRGVESCGMMCSAKELGVADDHSGIWIQPESMKVGEPFDAIIDIKVTPNRPDALSLVGLARDLAAKNGGKLRLPEVKFSESDTKTEKVAKVIVESREDCPRYAARVIRGVKIGPSPLWLQRRLEGAGLRPRNNIVDITNYVLLELGHPLHAFDLNKIANKTIIVRNAKAGEKMELLDETTVELQETDLLICDPEKPVALAGVMGGGNSEIDDDTTDVLLESAYFKPSTIRRTSKRLDKSTDASYRFERGTDPKRLINALHRAAQLIAELAGGEVLKTHLDVVAKLPDVEPITLRIDRVCRLSGVELTGREITDILGRLGFEIQRADEKELLVAVPSHRPDVTQEADLIEEVARIHGYDQIPSVLPAVDIAYTPASTTQSLRERIVREMMGMGYSETVNFSFVSEEANHAAGVGDDGRTVRVLNPLVQEQTVMRRSLLPSLLENVVHNFNHGVDPVQIFEIGHTYAWKDAEQPEDEDPKSLEPATEEHLFLAAAISGTRKADWRTPARELDFYDIKGVAERLLDRLGIRRTVIEPASDLGMFHPGRCAAILKGGERLCWFGELHPALARELDIKRRVFLIECPIEGAILEVSEEPKFQELPRFPATKRDVAVLVPKTTQAQDLERTIRSAGRPILADVQLFDLYEGKNLAENERSLAFSLTFRVADRTLTDDEVNKAFEAIIAALDKKHGARLR
ncbi:phenylalanine--tRNA ligase subunit beta [bacterium]|nr:phenylalanine--tRNA ligase subunit beta [bacterium]